MNCPKCKTGTLMVVSPVYYYFPIDDDGMVEYDENAEVVIDRNFISDDDFAACRSCDFEIAISGGEVIVNLEGEG